MPTFGPVQIDDCILDALRDDKLVVFAGAGVSMGAPSNLPDFSKLASDIASGTSIDRPETEPIDRFLGGLQHRGVQVHERAVKFLSLAGSAPTQLHSDLLRLFRVPDRVKLVTTNFDLHFEAAAEALFRHRPDVYRAPALPVGSRFGGIVHVHGVLTHSPDMVLTDADFGRAYLTEGWARRFLVDVFQHYTVLFVGYSHSDVVMNYLARALPADGVAKRFVLTDQDEDWNLLGITPVRFNKGSGGEPFAELYDGVKSIADRVSRGISDWRTRLAVISKGVPPADPELIGEIEQALREVQTTRFFTENAKDPGWPKWLDARKYLDPLFCDRDFNERDAALAAWLAKQYAMEHTDVLFELIANHKMGLNPRLWREICRQIWSNKEHTFETSSLKRLVTILLASAPTYPDPHALMWLSQRCDLQGVTSQALEVFLHMAGSRPHLKKPFTFSGQFDEAEPKRKMEIECPLRAEHWELNEVYQKSMKPNLPSIAPALLSGVSQCFEGMHLHLVAWEKASPEFDTFSYGRSAIEPHPQDQYQESVDVLIDAMRDALECLSQINVILLDSWIERLISSNVPILRRLAIHAMGTHPGLSTDAKLSWLLNRIGIHNLSEHHEVRRFATQCYPSASPSSRQAMIDAIQAQSVPTLDGWTAEDRTNWAHFEWLEWLQRSSPSCPLIESALAPITAKYPDLEARKHPDLTHWCEVGTHGLRSPWSEAELLKMPPEEHLSELLEFKGGSFDGPSREGLISIIREACKKDASWALALIKALIDRSAWDSDIWPSVLYFGQGAELSEADWRSLLSFLGRSELQAGFPNEIANSLFGLVRDGGRPFAMDLLEQANEVAETVWRTLPEDDPQDEIQEWVQKAINHPAGVLVEFWVDGLSLLMHGKSGDERVLPDFYLRYFSMVVQDSSIKGALGRSILASRLGFLFELSKPWATEILIPLFSDPDKDRFAQAWDGFLTWGRLYPALVDVLMPAFKEAIGRFSKDLPNQRRRFIEFMTVLALFHMDNPIQELLPLLLRNSSEVDRDDFASHFRYYLRHMQEESKTRIWNLWLRQYWENRLGGVPLPLDEGEIRKMLEWIPDLGEVFSEAISIAVRSRPIHLEHTFLVHELISSDLVLRNQVATAELLIYLCSCEVGYHGENIGKVSARLGELPSELRQRLNEGLDGIGATPPTP